MELSQGWRLVWAGPRCVMLSGVTRAWGPHPASTRAVLDAPGSDAALVRQLGAETASLRNNSCRPPWRHSLRRDKLAWFYAAELSLDGSAGKLDFAAQRELRQAQVVRRRNGAGSALQPERVMAHGGSSPVTGRFGRTYVPRDVRPRHGAPGRRPVRGCPADVVFLFIKY